MLLADALAARKDAITQIDDLRGRLTSAALRYEDQERAGDDPADVVARLGATLDRFESLTVRINRTNNATRLTFDERDLSLMEAIALRERLVLEAKARRGAVEAVEAATGAGGMLPSRPGGHSAGPPVARGPAEALRGLRLARARARPPGPGDNGLADRERWRSLDALTGRARDPAWVSREASRFGSRRWSMVCSRRDASPPPPPPMSRPGRKVRRDRSYQGATRSGNIGKCLTLSVMSRAPCSSAVAATA